MKPYGIREIAKKYVDNDMIQAHTELPDMPEPRLRALYAFLNQQQSLEKQSELYTLVILLVQLGMDTHDLIDTDHRKCSEQDMRSRQLKVLAGDYFSARFYQLLSKAGEIDMVSRISRAVCEVNRLKVNLYLRMRQLKMTAEEYMSQSIELRSVLFLLFAEVMDSSLSHFWPKALAGIAKCELAAYEIERCGNPASFAQSWAYWHILQAGTEEERQLLADSSLSPETVDGLIKKYSVHNQLSARLKQAAEAVKAVADKLESESLAMELNRIAETIVNNYTGFTPALNETR